MRKPNITESEYRQVMDKLIRSPQNNNLLEIAGSDLPYVSMLDVSEDALLRFTSRYDFHNWLIRFYTII